MIVGLAILNSLLMVMGQTLWKLGAGGKQVESAGQLLRLFTSWWIVGGFLVYVLASALWIYILSRAELSFVYPIQSLAFVFALVIGATLFKEQITVWKVVGVVVICIGVLIITRR